ncbi:hypothetical protein D3C87_2085700 [compost metagenome]
MVLVTTPPQPASNAFMILVLLSVGGADARTKGFTNGRPVKVVASLDVMAYPQDFDTQDQQFLPKSQ